MTAPVATTTSAAGIRWDLSDLFTGPDDPALTAALDSVTRDADDFAATYRGTINVAGGPSVDHLLGALRHLERVYDALGRLGSYVGLAFAADTQNPAIQNAQQRVQQRLTAVNNTILFFDL